MTFNNEITLNLLQIKFLIQWDSEVVIMIMHLTIEWYVIYVCYLFYWVINEVKKNIATISLIY